MFKYLIEVLKCLVFTLTLAIFISKADAAQSNFFRENISDYDAFEQSIEEGKQQIIDQAKDELNTIPEISNAEGEIQRLNNLNVHDLKSEGMKVRAAEENKYLNDIDIDYSQPGKQAIYKDAEAIANASDKLIDTMLKDISSLGIDCLETSGNRSIDNPYKLEIIREREKIVVYDQKFCEHLTNTYNCTNTLRLNCKSRRNLPLDLHIAKFWHSCLHFGGRGYDDVSNYSYSQSGNCSILKIAHNGPYNRLVDGNINIDFGVQNQNLEYVEIKNVNFTGVENMELVFAGHHQHTYGMGQINGLRLPQNMVSSFNHLTFFIDYNYGGRSSHHLEIWACAKSECGTWQETWEEVCVPR